MGPLVRAIGQPLLDLITWTTQREGDANSAAMAMGRQEHCFVSRRAETELDYRIRPLEETLADTWSWFREHGYV
jgi:dihydroflavonol-4-reductase